MRRGVGVERKRQERGNTLGAMEGNLLPNSFHGSRLKSGDRQDEAQHRHHCLVDGHFFVKRNADHIAQEQRGQKKKNKANRRMSSAGGAVCI